MAGLLDLLSNGESLTKISVDEIRRNERNFYATVTESEDEEILVENMANLIHENGQDSNGVVYEDTSIGDGKRYTLIAGERRYKAISLNKEKGLGDGMMDVKIIRKPANEDIEMLRLIENNSHRPKTTEIRKTEIKELEEMWQRMVENGTQPKGRKVNWIGKVIGMSPRQVQNYLNDAKEEADVQIETEESENENASDPKKKGEELTSSDKEQLLLIQNNMAEALGNKVKINQKKGSITLYPDTESGILEGVYSLIMFIGFDENGMPIRGK